MDGMDDMEKSSYCPRHVSFEEKIDRIDENVHKMVEVVQGKWGDIGIVADVRQLKADVLELKSSRAETRNRFTDAIIRNWPVLGIIFLYALSEWLSRK